MTLYFTFVSEAFGDRPKLSLAFIFGNHFWYIVRPHTTGTP